MADRGLFDKRELTDEKYTEYQVEQVLADIGVETSGETSTNIICLCPFHGNSNSGSMSISKISGLFMCFNPACDERGNLVQLVMYMTKMQFFPARRLIQKYRGTKAIQVPDVIDENNLPEYDSRILSAQRNHFLASQFAQAYMLGRGFTKATLDKFEIGYSNKARVVTIPMHDKYGKPIGVIGRSPFNKRFQNSDLLPTSKTLFNLHRAKKTGSEVIIVESAMDVMLLSQYGIENVVALCGGFFTAYHKHLISYHFDSVVIMTDFDDYTNLIRNPCPKCKDKPECIGHNPGRALGEKIQNDLDDIRVRWAAYSDGVFYPHGAKDPGELTKEEVEQCLSNKISHPTYLNWKKLYPILGIV